MRKRCTDCEQYKPISEFPRNKNTKDGFHWFCKDRNNARTRASRERLHGGSRHYHLKHRYGIGADDFGAVRGILCFHCNGQLGQFRDSVDALVHAAADLRAHAPEGRALDALARERAGELSRTPG